MKYLSLLLAFTLYANSVKGSEQLPKLVVDKNPMVVSLKEAIHMKDLERVKRILENSNEEKPKTPNSMDKEKNEVERKSLIRKLSVHTHSNSSASRLSPRRLSRRSSATATSSSEALEDSSVSSTTSISFSPTTVFSSSDSLSLFEGDFGNFIHLAVGSTIEILEAIFNAIPQVRRVRYLNDADANGMTPLLLAIKNNNFKVVVWLIQHGALVNYNRTLQSPLCLALFENNMHFASYLVLNGASFEECEELNAEQKEFLLRIANLHRIYVQMQNYLLHANTLSFSFEGITAMMSNISPMQIEQSSLDMLQNFQVNETQSETKKDLEFEQDTLDFDILYQSLTNLAGSNETTEDDEKTKKKKKRKSTKNKKSEVKGSITLHNNF